MGEYFFPYLWKQTFPIWVSTQYFLFTSLSLICTFSLSVALSNTSTVGGAESFHSKPNTVKENQKIHKWKLVGKSWQKARMIPYTILWIFRTKICISLTDLTGSYFPILGKTSWTSRITFELHKLSACNLIYV